MLSRVYLCIIDPLVVYYYNNIIVVTDKNIDRIYNIATVYCSCVLSAH